MTLPLKLLSQAPSPSIKSHFDVCEGCRYEFMEAVRYQDEEGLHYATGVANEVDWRKHFYLLMVDDEGRWQVG